MIQPSLFLHKFPLITFTCLLSLPFHLHPHLLHLHLSKILSFPLTSFESPPPIKNKKANNNNERKRQEKKEKCESCANIVTTVYYLCTIIDSLQLIKEVP